MRQWLQDLLASLLRRRLTLAERSASIWRRESLQLLRALSSTKSQIERELKSHQDSVNRGIERVSSLYERAESLVARYERVEEAYDAELKILKEGVVPVLSLHLEKLRAEKEADIAVEAKRRAGADRSIPKADLE